MDAAEIVVHEPKRDSSGMVLDLLRKGVSQARETANTHSHGQVLPLYERRAHMLRVGIPAHYFYVTANAGCRRVAPVVVNRSAVNFLQLRVINIRPERSFYGL